MTSRERIYEMLVLLLYSLSVCSAERSLKLQGKNHPSMNNLPSFFLYVHMIFEKQADEMARNLKRKMSPAHHEVFWFEKCACVVCTE